MTFDEAKALVGGRALISFGPGSLPASCCVIEAAPSGTWIHVHYEYSNIRAWLASNDVILLEELPSDLETGEEDDEP